MKDLTDYAAGLVGAGSCWWRSGPAGESLFGNNGNHMIVGREERRSMTNKIDTHGEFEDRSPQPMPVKEMASAIEPTRRGPVQDFSKFGQSGYREAEEAKQAEESMNANACAQSEGVFEPTSTSTRGWLSALTLTIASESNIDIDAICIFMEYRLH